MNVICWECGEDAADVSAAGRVECFCTTHADESPIDDEYQGRTFEQEVDSLGAWR